MVINIFYMDFMFCLLWIVWYFGGKLGRPLLCLQNWQCAWCHGAIYFSSMLPLSDPFYNLIRELNWRAPINIWRLDSKLQRLSLRSFADKLHFIFDRKLWPWKHFTAFGCDCAQLKSTSSVTEYLIFSDLIHYSPQKPLQWWI